MCWNRRLLQLACLCCALSSRHALCAECFCLLTGRCCCVCYHAARWLCADFSSLVAKDVLSNPPPTCTKDLPLGAKQSRVRCSLSNSHSTCNQSPSVDLRTYSVTQKGAAGSSRRELPHRSRKPPREKNCNTTQRKLLGLGPPMAVFRTSPHDIPIPIAQWCIF